MAASIVRQQGVLALYSGLSASLCRQLTYSTTRFGIYEVIYFEVVWHLIFFIIMHGNIANKILRHTRY